MCFAQSAAEAVCCYFIFLSSCFEVRTHFIDFDCLVNKKCCFIHNIGQLEGNHEQKHYTNFG